jgi:hypothetical protein
MGEMARSRPETRKPKARAAHQTGQRTAPAEESAGLTRGAAAAQRASAGMGTQDLEPTDWLFGDTLRTAPARPY